MKITLAGRKGAYSIEDGSPLAAGRLANIYLAEGTSSGEEVAIKRFHRHFYEESLESYLRELVHLSELNHPNILPVLDWSHTAGADRDCFLVLPYMEQGNLRSLLQGRKFCPPALLMPIVREVAAGLDHAHSSGVVHGDIKPENILMGGSPRAARLSDFGVARHFVVEDMVATGAGLFKPQGASAYLSPEQLVADASSPRSDLYSFALVVYELLTGRLPYDLREPLFVQLKARVDGNLLPPEQANAQLSEPIAQALTRALDVDPAKRPNSASAFARLLERVPKKWDIFIAHAGADLASARTLLELLEPHLKVFLDNGRLKLGDNWDLELSTAQ
ncbi:MAG: protein kinase, partial [Rhizobacter sp.]|nr:protein kinase [Rhizobacter sp.]